MEGPKLRGLRALRLDLALSQRDLAAASGVAQATINRLELGHRSAHPSTVRKLAKALQVEPRALYGPDGGGPGPVTGAVRGAPSRGTEGSGDGLVIGGEDTERA